MRRLDITGERYGRLVATERIDGLTCSRWKFKCDCGNQTTALLSNIRTGQIKSCGCAGSRTTIGLRSTKHGHSFGYRKSRTAASWRNAKTRCFNQANHNYPLYGGRGITMCQEWVEDFRAFLRDMGPCPRGHTLDRIDVNGNYEPGNCRWATPTVQANNKRDTIRVDGLPLKDYAISTGIDYKRLHYRMTRHGETPQQAAEWFKLRKIGRNSKRTVAD
jgi:hypothetical protein